MKRCWSEGLKRMHNQCVWDAENSGIGEDMRRVCSYINHLEEFFVYCFLFVEAFAVIVLIEIKAYLPMLHYVHVQRDIRLSCRC